MSTGAHVCFASSVSCLLPFRHDSDNIKSKTTGDARPFETHHFPEKIQARLNRPDNQG